MNFNRPTPIVMLAIGGMLAFNSIATAAGEAKPTAPAAAEKQTETPAPAAEKKASATVPTEADIAKREADLGLSPELTAKVDALMKEQNARRKQMYQDANLSEADRAAKNKAIVAETREKIKAVLTPEQYAKWEKLHEARKAYKAAQKK
jgi:hypothetical protein